MTTAGLLEGTVVRSHGGHYYVERDGAPDEVLDCGVRGRLKQEAAESDLIAIGDRVRYTLLGEGRGMVEEVLPRKSALSRCPPPPRPQVEQVIVANLDLVLAVFSVVNPPLNPFMLDRYLVACEVEELDVAIVANKVDLVRHKRMLRVLAVYESIGYRVVRASATTGEGLGKLRELMRGRLTALTGPSGAGKSSLLNALWPHLELETGEVSSYHDRGTHTTVVSQILRPEEGFQVADTPGLRQFRLWDIAPEDLDGLFPEMRPYAPTCRFSPCSHRHEPGCAVQAAVERGQIPEIRYESYCRMYEHGF